MAVLKADIIEAHIFRRTSDGIEFLLLKRASGELYPDLWQMVSGSKEDGETSYHAALRETFEETGIVPVNIWVAPVVNSFYNPLNDAVTVIPVFLLEAGSNAEVVLSPEHVEYMWGSREQVIPLLAWAGQRNAVEICFEYLTNRKSFLNFTEILINDKG